MDPVDRRRFLRIAGVSLGAGALYRVAAPARGEGGRLMNLLGKSNGEKPTPFSFVQFSDTHVGFSGPPDPLGTKAGIAVLTLSHFPPPPAGETYRGWMLQNGRWTSLGIALPDAAGRARLISEDPALATRPDAVEVTRESATPGAAPGGPVVAKWPDDRE